MKLTHKKRAAINLNMNIQNHSCQPVLNIKCQSLPVLILIWCVPVLAKSSAVLWGRFTGMQNTPKREVLQSPGAGICTGAKGRSRDRSNEMRTTFSTTAELTTHPGLALCVSRAAWLPEGGNCKREEMNSEEGKWVSAVQLPDFF